MARVLIAGFGYVGAELGRILAEDSDDDVAYAAETLLGDA